MPPDPFFERALTRRAFLGRGLAAAGGLAVAGGVLADSAFAAPDPKTYFPLVLSSDLYASPQPQRFVLALAHSGSSGRRFASGPAVAVRFKSPEGAWSPLTRAAYDRVGLPKGRGVYVSRPVLDTPGVWKVEAHAQGQRVPFTIQVNTEPVTLVPGMAAPGAASPTTADTLGVDPICTRDPACPLHTQSLSTVIGAGKPVAALFATPARCQSAYCAPVLDEFLDVSKDYGDQIVPVHIEIYQGPTGTALVPTLAAWHVETEPWLFGVDAAGTIQSRIDGAFGGTEMKALLDALVGRS